MLSNVAGAIRADFWLPPEFSLVGVNQGVVNGDVLPSTRGHSEYQKRHTRSKHGPRHMASLMWWSIPSYASV